MEIPKPTGNPFKEIVHEVPVLIDDLADVNKIRPDTVQVNPCLGEFPILWPENALWNRYLTYKIGPVRRKTKFGSQVWNSDMHKVVSQFSHKRGDWFLEHALIHFSMEVGEFG
jgi:hypothetical protein